MVAPCMRSDLAGDIGWCLFQVRFIELHCAIFDASEFGVMLLSHRAAEAAVARCKLASVHGLACQH